MSENLKEWCAGLPFVENRPLTEEEQHELNRQSRLLRLRVWGVLSSGPLLLFLLGVLDDLTSTHSPIAQDALTVVLVGFVFVYLPFGYLLIRDASRRRKGLIRDVKAGVVKRFGGTWYYHPATDETFQKLKGAKLLPEKPSEGWWLEVLPHSKRVWKTQSGPVQRWIEAQWNEVAETPAFAAVASNWLEQIQKTDDALLLGGRRDLDPNEKKELRRFMTRLWRNRLPGAVGLTSWWSILMILRRTGNAMVHQSPTDRGHFQLLSVFTLTAILNLVVGIYMALQLRRDIQAGYLILLRSETRNDPQGGSGTTDTEQTGVKVIETVELLPVTRRLWTVEGRPAPWRMTRL